MSDRPPPATEHEASRLRALEALQILDTPPEPAFEALAGLASAMLGCPMSLVTLIDRHRQWVKASAGINVRQTDREVAFCDHTIRSPGPLIIHDTGSDVRFRDNPLVTGRPHIRFYAGMPLHAQDPVSGETQAVGAICGIDTVPRSLTPEQRTALEQLGLVAEAILAARSISGESLKLAEIAHNRAVQLQRSVTAFRQAERIAAIGSWRYDVAADSIEWSEGVYRIHEVPADTQIDLPRAMSFFPPESRDIVDKNMMAARETGQPFDFEADFCTATGRRRRVRSLGECNVENGGLVVAGVFQDVTERHELEQHLRRLADTDELTGIANRAAFDRLLTQNVEAAGAARAPLLLALIDLDLFKQINDAHGHLAGDEVLRAVGDRLRSFAGPECTPARLGGDEFALIVRDQESCARPEPFIERLLAHLKRPVASAAFGCLPVSVTVGYDTYDAAMDSTQREFVHRVDSALYIAKRAGRGGSHRHTAFGRRASDGQRMSQRRADGTRASR